MFSNPDKIERTVTGLVVAASVASLAGGRERQALIGGPGGMERVELSGWSLWSLRSERRQA